MEKFQKEIKNEINNISNDLDAITSSCIEIQRQLFEITFDHRLNNQELEKNSEKKKADEEAKKINEMMDVDLSDLSPFSTQN